MADAEKTDKHAAPETKAKKSKLLPIVLALVLVLLAGGGAAGYWMYSKRAAADPASQEPAVPTEPGVVDLETFVVNLADEGGRRFLRLSMKLLTADEEQAAELKEDPVTSARVRSAILELLSLQHAAPLVTPEGKEELKKAIAERANEAMAHGEAAGADAPKVVDVLFVEFIVQ
jgi:flagellar FliL protein